MESLTSNEQRLKKPPPERGRVTVECSDSGSIERHRDSMKSDEDDDLDDLLDRESNPLKNIFTSDRFIHSSSSNRNPSLDDLLDKESNPLNSINTSDRFIHNSSSNRNPSLQRPYYDRNISYYASDDIILDDDLLMALAYKNDELLAKQNDQDLQRYEEELLLRNKQGQRETNVKIFSGRVCVMGLMFLVSIVSLVYYFVVVFVVFKGGDNDDRTTTTRVAATTWEKKKEEYIERIANVCQKVDSSTVTHDKHPFHYDVIKCSQLCAPKMCCFSTTTTSDSNNPSSSTRKTCLNDNNSKIQHRSLSSSTIQQQQQLPSSLSCDAYAPCAILNTMNDDRSLVNVSVVTDKCSVDNIKRNEGFGICQRLCAKRACCFLPLAQQQQEGEEEQEEVRISSNGSSSCDSVNVEWCGEFEACRNLLKVRPRP